MSNNTLIFFYSLVLLILFGWYVMSDSDRAKRIVGTVLSLLLVAFCLWLVNPPFGKQGKIALGLDLRGGTSFLIQLMPATGEGTEPRPISSDMVERAMEAIRKRIDQFGVAEPIITPQSKDRILVQIPGLDLERIKDAREQLQ